MYCRNCGKELMDDCKFCPYCGKKVTTVGSDAEGQVTEVQKEKTITPEIQEKQSEHVADKKGKKKFGKKKIVVVLGIVFVFAVLGVGIRTLANNAKENRKAMQEEVKPTVTPEPTNTLKPTATSTPKPIKVSTIDDVILFVSEEHVELGTERKVIRVQIVENGYNTSKSLTYEIEDTSVVSCEWGEWGTNLTVPLRIYPLSVGETTIKIRLEDSDICKEIRVVSNSGNEVPEKEVSETAEATMAPTPTEKPKATEVPTPTEKPKVTATSTPKPTVTPEPTKIPIADDMELRLSSTSIEIDGTPQEIKVEVIENGYSDWDSLKCYVEDRSIVTYDWGDWEDTDGHVCPLIITAKSAGETTLTVRILDAENKTIVSKEIKVISTYEPSLENVKLEVSPESVRVGEKPQTVIIEINRNGYNDSISLMFFVEDETVAGAMWDKSTEENDLIIYGKKQGTTSVFIGVSGGKGVVEVKVTSDGATVMATSTPKPTATPKPAATATPTPKPVATSTPKPTATPKPAATATPKRSTV